MQKDQRIIFSWTHLPSPLPSQPVECCHGSGITPFDFFLAAFVCQAVHFSADAQMALSSLLNYFLKALLKFLLSMIHSSPFSSRFSAALQIVRPRFSGENPRPFFGFTVTPLHHSHWFLPIHCLNYLLFVPFFRRSTFESVSPQEFSANSDD
jgi:hypothetical protein